MHEGVQPASRQDPVAGENVEVPSPWVLWQVAVLASAVYLSVGGKRLTGQRGERGGLTGPITADQTDPVAGLDAQRDTGEKSSGARAKFQVCRGDHKATNARRRPE